MEEIMQEETILSSEDRMVIKKAADSSKYQDSPVAARSLAIVLFLDVFNQLRLHSLFSPNLGSRSLYDNAGAGFHRSRECGLERGVRTGNSTHAQRKNRRQLSDAY